MNWSDIATAAATLFFVMDPLGNIAIFNAVLARFPPRRRAQITARELVIALVILLVFLFAGTGILKFLGLSQPSLAIAGGILLFIIAANDLPHRRRRGRERERRADDRAAGDADGRGPVDDCNLAAALFDAARADLGMVHGARDRLAHYNCVVDGVAVFVARAWA